MRCMTCFDELERIGDGMSDTPCLSDRFGECRASGFVHAQ